MTAIHRYLVRGSPPCGYPNIAIHRYPGVLGVLLGLDNVVQVCYTAGMAKSQMVNFRAPHESVEMYDEAADAAGMTRSQWLRNAAELALASFRDGGFTPKAQEVSVPAGPKCIDGNWRACENADWRRLPNGTKQCATCNIRVRS